MSDIEQRLREDVARAWASIDGKVEQFDLEKNNPNLAYDDPSYVGSYEGYLTEADELLKRSGVGALVASLRSKLEEAEGALKAAREFIADEFNDDAYEEFGEWLPPEARAVHKQLCEAEATLASLREADHA